MITSACADPGFFARGRGRRPEKRLNNAFFFSPLPFFTVYRGVPMILLHWREKYTFQRIQRGSNIFQVRSDFFQGWVQMLISIETHITCDFFPVPGPPIPRLLEQSNLGPPCLLLYLNLSVMLDNYLQQTTSADVIFQMHFFLALIKAANK